MKKIFFYFMIACLSSTLNLTVVKASPMSSKTENSIDPEIEGLMHRLEEIKSIEIKKLRRPEKRKLRTEVLSIAEKLKRYGPVIYISGGALILIIILLIILL